MKGKIYAHIVAPPPSSDGDEIKRLRESINNSGNTDACLSLLAGYYQNGSRGLPQDWNKANELYQKAGELGYAGGYFNLGNSYYYGRGVEVDKKKARHYYELAAMNGCASARHNIGALEGMAGNNHRAMKLYITAARAGYDDSLYCVKENYMRGFITKSEYENVLRAYQQRQKETKSDDREKAAASGMYRAG